MVIRKTHTRSKNLSPKVLLGLFAVSALALSLPGSVRAEDPSGGSTFEVNVGEMLSVTVTTPDKWASGDTGAFVRNTIVLDVASNNSNGFVATMGTKNSDASLTNDLDATATIPTLTKSYTRASFPVDRWGYSLGDYQDGVTVGDSAAGNDKSIYRPMSSTSSPVTLLSSSSASSGSQNIYLGAKISSATTSGWYSGTITISVVSGTVNPSASSSTGQNASSVSPASASSATPQTASSGNDPSSGSTSSQLASYSTGRTVNVASSSDSSDVPGAPDDTVSSASQNDLMSSYAPPQGVSDQVGADIDNSNSVASALAVASATAAATGAALLVYSRLKG